ncbi:Phosphatidate cytidylyltransferase (CDP-diacylglycerol synthase) [Bradyrhizobium sp. ORS 285]|uniref:phosphatidate cytidylyltransferase n=1 Tax=Bradyrhizobium sp. ORS 285 TaxID=115808 RepID=UPI00024094AD|nr:phosphatidate cytidylyltransferase [Bradyrhizobium sp. ORS 285]CCD85764.1 Phosphatidate cytidylyltransferase (CDP-diacylglycerol synthase) [Bradyrhizobium sp. ORS 285]SMX58244.1 Phosphatidate cytidylyltransferase (CDP-diacylglycerol synthase) [Bradyrhizobium sp. ORS 285]
MTHPETATAGDAADPAQRDDAARAKKAGPSNLVMRIAAALVLVPLALGAAYAGGAFWTALVTVVAVGLYLEWLMVIGEVRTVSVGTSGALAIAIAGICCAFGLIDFAVVVLALGLVAVAALAAGRRLWGAAGFVYAAGAELASVLVRFDQQQGWHALVLVFLVVWASDIGGYVAGRSIGGVRLAPRISPNKTWAGAIGGFAASLVAAMGWSLAGAGGVLAMLTVAAVLSVVSQLGDLAESAVKRHFGVKDSSHIIPGHGGLLDRLDGYVAAIVFAAVVGLLRGGLDGVGRGLLVW